MHYNGLTAALLQADHSAIVRQLWHYPWVHGCTIMGKTVALPRRTAAAPPWANGSIITDRRRHHYIVSPPQ